MRPSLADLLQRDPYQAYTYSYPHKTSYRPLDPPVALRSAWAGEDRSALFLYLHVPFCEQRGGFCNLFTQAQPQEVVVDRYLTTLERQAEIVADALAPARFARLAIGGGTPTFLCPAQLERLLAIPGNVPSPANFPSGCRFHPRCPQMQADCPARAMELREPMPGRFARCDYWELTPPNNAVVG